MKLDDVLASPCIDIHDTSEFERKYHSKEEIINEERHKDIASLAYDVGLCDSFRRQLPEDGSGGLWFFKELYEFTRNPEDLDLYEHHVDIFEWDGRDERIGSFVFHWLALYKETKKDTYLGKIRNGIDNAPHYTPEETFILNEVRFHRTFDLKELMKEFGHEDIEDEEIRTRMLEDPTQKEVEKVVQRACSSRLAYAFGQAVQLYDISRSTLDLSRAIESYNYFLVDADHGNKPNFFFSAISGLTGLLKSTRRNAIREEYRRITLDEAREEQNLGSSFDSMKDLFLMTRLSEDRASVEELVDRGTVLLRNEITSDFSGFVDGLFDLFKATGDRSFLDMYESMTMTVDEKKFHPDYFDENPLIALPLFQATGDSAYIPDIIAYCESSIEKEEYRTAEAIYFEMFQLTGDKGYFDKARELLEITKERASAEKPFLNLTSLFSSLDQEISSEGAIYTAVTGETYEHGSFMPSRRIMNEAQVAARISSDVDALIRYVYVSPTQEDINSLRKNISILDEMSADDFVIRGHLFDLYQITGASEDYTRIKKSFESFAAQDSNIGRCSLLLKQISR